MVTRRSLPQFDLLTPDVERSRVWDDPEKEAPEIYLPFMVEGKAEEGEGDEGSAGVLRDVGDRASMGEAPPVALKFDNDKSRLDLVPNAAILEAGHVFAFGADKYGERNWELGLPYGRLYAALGRHLAAWWDGEELDPESRLHHLGHAMCCLMMLGEEVLNERYHGEGLDDRTERRP